MRLARALLLLLAAFLARPASAQDCLAPDPALDAQAANLPPAITALLLLNAGQPSRAFCPAPGSGPSTPQDAAFNPPPAIEPAPAIDPSPAVDVVAVAPGGPADIGAVAAALGLVIVEQRASPLLGGVIARLSPQDGRPAGLVLAQLAADPRIAASDVNALFQMQGEMGAGMLPAALGLGALHSRATGKGVKVAVLDSGVDAGHPALAGAIEAQFDAIPREPARDVSHGTAIAGLIAGRASMPGAAPDARLLIARIFEKGARARADASVYTIAAALDWAVERGAAIVNMSFAGPRNRVMSRALSSALQKGVTLIAAAGNGGPGAPHAYPGAEPGVIAVTATDALDKIYGRANRGPYIAVAAPGVDIMAPAPQGRGALVSGTSFSAAIVSGLAALYRERAPGAGATAFAARLSATARDLGQPGPDETFGAGQVNAAALIAAE